MTRPTPTLGPYGWFCAWIAVGAIASLTVLGAFSILGLIALPASALVAWPTARYSKGTGASGIVTGLGVPCLYVAYLNRQGPGNICTNYAGGGQSCTQEYNPLFWAAGALTLIATGLIIFIAQQHRTYRLLQPRRATGPFT